VEGVAAAPARLAGLDRKGGIVPGHDADLVAFAPERRFTVRGGDLHHRHPVTAYAGRDLTGTVTRTWLRGVPVSGDAPRGAALHRGGRT
jgi:allantoinase